MRFTGRGHPAIRATHDKTLELVADEALTERGTCIVAVGAEAEPARPLAGPVRVRIAAAGQRFSLDAVANPNWQPDGPVVIRRGPLRLPGTFATDATAAASDLPRDLVTALADPDTLVTLDVQPLPSGPVIVLCAADPNAAGPSAALQAELDRADEVVVEDAAARRLAGPPRGEPGGRTVVVACDHLPRSRTGTQVDVVGLAPLVAVAAACGGDSPVTVTDDPSELRRVPVGHRLTLMVIRRQLPELLRRAERDRGVSVATVMQQHGRPLLATSDALPDLAGADEVAVCLHPATESDALDPAVHVAVSALLADGVPTKTTAKALAALTGWERRRAYDAVVNWSAT